MLRLIVFTALTSLGCSPPPDPAAAIAPTPADCKRPTQRCRLKDGTLGVCQQLTADQPYQCTPQH